MYRDILSIIGCLILIGNFPQKSPILSGSFAERDLQSKATFSAFSASKADVEVQPVPWKTRLEMLNYMEIEILNGEEILVNYKFKFNKNLNLNLYREIPRNSNLNSTLYREIPRDLIFSILTS